MLPADLEKLQPKKIYRKTSTSTQWSPQPFKMKGRFDWYAGNLRLRNDITAKYREWQRRCPPFSNVWKKPIVLHNSSLLSDNTKLDFLLCCTLEDWEFFDSFNHCKCNYTCPHKLRSKIIQPPIGLFGNVSPKLPFKSHELFLFKPIDGWSRSHALVPHMTKQDLSLPDTEHMYTHWLKDKNFIQK